MDTKSVMEKLQAPFEPSEIEWRVGATNGKPKANPPVIATKGIALAYVTNRAIQNRLDDVFGCFGWQNEFKEWKGNSQICGISVYDEDKKIWITKWDGADDSQTEAIKGGLSDSMKRAAYQWGIGRYLYNLPQTWVNLKNGKYLAETPELPDWALPKGYKKASKTRQNGTGATENQNKGNNPGTITEDEQKQLFAICKGNTSLVKEVLLAHGYTSSKQVKKSEYEAICNEIMERVV